jgi:Tol biopolymer transport system component
MSCFPTRPRAHTHFALALLGTVALWACDEQPSESPTEPLAEPADALLKDASKKALIAFASDRDGGNTEIYVMKADGRKPRRLTNDDASDGQAAWSPDRTKIAFTKFPISGGSDIYIMNSDGTNPAHFAAGAQNPDWSPDGTRIAFDGDGVIIVRSVDGSSETTLSAAPGWTASEPDWSPDGTRIAFLRTEVGGGSENVWVMNADGTNQVELTTQGGSGPAWSPDGSKIAFTTDRDVTSEVYVMNADGTGQTRLTDLVGPSGVPAWSPDGSRIAFQSLRDGNTDIYVMNADGSGVTQLTTEPALDASPGWAR